ncbi:non-canonical non-ribosomal peptide synthetase FUB8 [Naviculisporaceae sp. PSN 640]
MPSATIMNADTRDTAPEPRSGNMAVILTGSTGSLGSYLLDSLARQDHVRKIYCLNRAEDGGLAKQKVSSLDRGLDIAAWGEDNRVEFLHCDLSQPAFGLSPAKYRELLRETTHVIHNQWPVNFNWDLSSFEPHIRGVRHLLDFCADSPGGNIEFLFISTIGTVGEVRGQTLVPETPNHELSPLLNGYCASKLICELIIEDHVTSNSHSHRSAAICRVGQIAGPALKESGMWNKQEWLPSVIASSKYMGLLPSNLGSLDVANWVPVDYLSEIILEMAGVVGQLQPQPATTKKTGSASGLTIYHAVNPHNVSWAELVPTVASQLGIESNKIVSWNQWVEALRLSAQEKQVESGGEKEEGGKTADEAHLEKNPGIKLLDFFGSLGKGNGSNTSAPLPSTEKSTVRSKTLASLQPVGAEWMSLWIRQLGL